MKHLLTVMALMFFLMCPVAGNTAPNEDNITIGISIPTADHGWTGGIVWWAEKIIAELAIEHPNIKIRYAQAENYVEQNYSIEEMLTSGIDALVILPHNPPHLANILRKAHSAGVFIVIVDRTAPTLVGDIYIAPDNYRFGQLAGEFLAKASGGQGKAVVMEGIPCEVNTLRVKGFMDAIAAWPGITILDSQPAYWSNEKGFELMQYYLENFDQIDMVWAGDDDVMLGALAAYKQSGRTDIKFMIGGGGSKEIVKMIMDNDPLVVGTVTYPPQVIYEAIKMTVSHLVEGRTFDKRIIMPSEWVTRENAESYYYPDSIY